MDIQNGTRFNRENTHSLKYNLHYLEEKLMVSPLKKLMLTHFELTIFLHMLEKTRFDLTGKNILEVGCGAGYGIVQLYNKFKPKNLSAFDVNPKMVALSRGQVKKRKIPAQISWGDVSKISTPVEKFDAVFVFTVLHHVEKWQFGLREINKVLKPGGLLFIEEICDRSLNWFERYLKVYHPKKARFTWEMFYSGLSDAGFKVIRDFKFLGDLGFFLCVKVRSS